MDRRQTRSCRPGRSQYSSDFRRGTTFVLVDLGDDRTTISMMSFYTNEAAVLNELRFLKSVALVPRPIIRVWSAA